MDCARFIEENGTLENQRGALSLSFLHKEREKREQTIVYWYSISNPRNSHSDRYIPVKKVWNPLLRLERSSKVQDKKIPRSGCSVNLFNRSWHSYRGLFFHLEIHKSTISTIKSNYITSPTANNNILIKKVFFLENDIIQISIHHITSIFIHLKLEKRSQKQSFFKGYNVI